MKKYYLEHSDVMKNQAKKWQSDHHDEFILYNRKRNSKKIVFKGKQIVLKENPRKGVCQNCFRKVGGEIRKTDMHHIKYHDNDPLKDTVELCVRCHSKVKR